MDTQKLLTHRTNKFFKIYIVLYIIAAILIIVFIWIGLTKVGFIPNFLDILILYPSSHSFVNENPNFAGSCNNGAGGICPAY